MKDIASKYDVNDAKSKALVKRIFDHAIGICNYKDICQMQMNDKHIMSSYDIGEEDVNLSIATLWHDDEGFYVTVRTAYYSYSILLVDVTESILAYLIRNATKVNDDFDDSISFFIDFFNQRPLFESDELFMATLQSAVVEYLEPSYIYSNICKTTRKKVSKA